MKKAEKKEGEWRGEWKRKRRLRFSYSLVAFFDCCAYHRFLPYGYPEP